MNNPTLQELMDYVDGTLEPSQAQVIEQMIAHSKRLQYEITLLKTMKETIGHTHIAPSKSFTRNVMNEIQPYQESLWFTVIKNSSHAFAMLLVLSLIGIVLFSSPGAESITEKQVSNMYHSIAGSFRSVSQELTVLMTQYSKPFDVVVKTTSGRMLFIGLFIFALYIIVDEVFVKKIVLRK